jgi:hypothetical protein
VSTVLDTLVVDADQRRATLMWRGHLRLRGVHDLVAVELRADAGSMANVAVAGIDA